MGFYGDINNINKTIFQFDKIYANKAEMDAAANSDGVFVGRYVLVEYGNNEDIINPDSPQTEQKTAYEYNYKIDSPDGTSRGWDSTVWQKISIGNEYQYIMIAELNSVIPTIGIEVNAPTESPALPIWNIERSSNILYKLQLQPSWGFRVKEAAQDEPSDYVDENQKRYSIYFNKAGFNLTHHYISNLDDKIEVKPTGRSSNTYANQDNNTKDIYELSIQLPSIGNAISQLWDIIYGEGELDEQNNLIRNTNIGSDGIRAITYNNNQITYNSNNLNTIVGLINSVQDLIGNINTDEVSLNNVNNWDENVVYYVNNGLYYKAKHYINGEWNINNGYEAKSFSGLAEDLNTIYSLIITIKEKLANGDASILDENTVQGAINLLNQLRADFTGGIFGDNTWINAGNRTNANNETEVVISHKQLNSVPTIDTANVVTAFDNNNDIYSYYPTVDNAGHVTAINKKKITLDVLGIDSVNDDIDSIKDFVGMSDSTTENDSLSDQISKITSLIRKNGDTIILGENNTNLEILGNGYKKIDNNFIIEKNEEIQFQTKNQNIEINEWENLDLNGPWKIYILQELADIQAIQNIYIKENNTIRTRLTGNIDYIWDNQKTIQFRNERISFNNSNYYIAIEYSVSIPIYNYSLTFGSRKNATEKGKLSIAMGNSNEASGNYAYAEGSYTTASSSSSHAEGTSTVASGMYSHAEGGNTTASGITSHAEGYNTTASGKDSHAEGLYTVASGNYSHAQNQGTTAGIEAQTVIGKYNIAEDNSSEIKHAFIIGNGTNSERSNALTVDWDGNIVAGTYNEVNIEQLSSNVTTIDETIEQLSSNVTTIDETVESLSTSINTINTTIGDLPTAEAMNNAIAAVQPIIEDVTNQFSISAKSYTNRQVTIEKVFKYGEMIYVWLQIPRTVKWTTGSDTNGRFFLQFNGPYLPLLTTPICTPLGVSEINGYILGKFGERSSTAITPGAGYNIFLVPSAEVTVKSSERLNIYFQYMYDEDHYQEWLLNNNNDNNGEGE